MESWVESALSKWKQEGVALNPGATLTDFNRVEYEIEFNFPDDFKELYSVVNGFVDFEETGFMLSLWSLERIVDSFANANSLIMFSDHCLSICQYGFSKTKKGIYRAHTHHQKGPIDFIAGSFKEAIGLINTNSELLF